MDTNSIFCARDYVVRGITFNDCAPWLLQKHYARRIPVVVYAFGLFRDNTLNGIITFGSGANISNNEIAGITVLELNRLCVTDGLPRNALSWFVSKAIKLLPMPLYLLSYADEKQGHVGYIYQATNWLYTGQSEVKRFYVKDGKEFHRKSMWEMGYKTVNEAEKAGFTHIRDTKKKHRYFYLHGNKQQRQLMMKNLPYSVVLGYPKGESKRYDCSATFPTQAILF